MSMYQVMSRGIDIYGIEVLPVKSIRELPQELTERLELPEEALLAAAKLTVTGGKRALVENHRGVLEYGQERIVVFADVIDSKSFVVGRYHQSSGTFQQDIFVPLLQLASGRMDFPVIYRAPVPIRGHVWRAGVGEDIGAGESHAVLLQFSDALYFPVCLNIFRGIYTSRLNHLLGDDAFPFFRDASREDTCGIGLAYVGINA